jgi:antitoxin Phd
MNVGDTTRGRVLIVARERAVLDRYCRWLDAAGFEVTAATGGAEALKRIENEQFDAVLSDILMPTTDGFALLRHLRARSLDVPVIVMLDAVNNRLAIRAMELGVLQCLVKPIDQVELEKAAACAVRAHRSLGALAAMRNRRGERVDHSSFSATEAKNEFGHVLELVIQGGVVVITKHQAPKAVLVSLDQFNELARATESKLDTLSDEFDALLARMQTPKARAGMKAAFNASPKQLGRAAVLAARKRG